MPSHPAVTTATTTPTSWRWQRHAPMDPNGDGPTVETWSGQSPAGEMFQWEVEVTTGKPFDVVGVKGVDLRETRDHAGFLAEAAERLYAHADPRRREPCPCCDQTLDDAPEVTRIHGVGYTRCPGCGHVTVGARPDPAALRRLFESSEEHSIAYTDRDRAETRIEQIVRPKLAWLIDCYAGSRGRPPSTIIDVGAGGGHFVAACRREGYEAIGYEISRASRRFAEEVFGLKLKTGSFATEPNPEPLVDVITMWGLLEYTVDLSGMVAAARRRLDTETGILVVEVPRYDCLGSAIQVASPNTVARHLDPTSHVQCFSDASVATLLARGGFRPIAAWYFGMDVYELLIQLALEAGDEKVPPGWWRRLETVQRFVDYARFSDDLVVAAVPEVGG